MAEDKSNDCEVVPTRETGQFHFRVCFSPIEAPLSVRTVARSVVAGCICHANFFRCHKDAVLDLILVVRHGSNPTMDGIKVIPNMVLLDKTGLPASMGTATTSRSPQDNIAYNLDVSSLLSEDVRANCVVDNHFQVMCSVEVVRDGAPVTAPSTAEEEFPGLGHDLAMMSHKQQLTDVSFDVDGESFSAHRLVLAARSPVFRAELYGSMAESKMASITIQEMGASTFRSMLHYMYHGSLPDAGKADVSSTMAEYQRLLAAADRYGVERLKKICEDKLCVNSITVDNVVSTLELAERHVCPKFKASCLDFLSDGENLKMVATTDEYFNLMQSVPSVLVEVRNRFKMPHENPTITEAGSHKKSRMC
jgi:speckle-type POZ protein